MSEPADEKIELLVRSVLAAVDARLAEVRHELHELATRVDQRHDEVTALLRDLERRVEHGATTTGPSAAGADPLAARMEQATQVLLERIEAMHQRNTIATNERFALLNDALEQIRGGSPAVAAAPVLPALDAMNAPIRVGPITAQQPLVAASPPRSALADSPPHAEIGGRSEATSAPNEPAAPSAAASPNDPIDIDRLADLLSERLGHLSLPPQSP